MITINTLKKMKTSGEKIACLTAYDASFADVLEQGGVEVLLVGDSLGMVVQGLTSTLPVSVDDIVYHAKAVATQQRSALLMVDMPFMSYATVERAIESAARLMQEGRAHMVKLEGTANQAQIVEHMVAYGVPVCAHLGLRPQFVHKLGGYRVQGRDQAVARALVNDAQVLEQAGADALLLECVPSGVAAEVTASVEIPVIGIGAGRACDGQILVLYDVLGITPGKRPKFSKDFLVDNDSIVDAVSAYVQAVKGGEFPAPEHWFD